MGADVIGSASSAVLLLTVGKQVHKQWRDGSSKGVSKWLFVGQIAASGGFTAYSLLIGNWVFVATNGLMAVSAVAGLLLVLRHRGSPPAREGRRTKPGPGRPAVGPAE